jgi:hypothetical protein
MTDKTQSPAAAKEPVINQDTNWKQIKSVAPQALCKKCGSKKLTDLNGNPFCPQELKECPLV